MNLVKEEQSQSRTKQHRVHVNVNYPVPEGGILSLRSSENWERDISAVGSDGDCWSFTLDFDKAYLEFIPYLNLEGDIHEAQGGKRLATRGCKQISLTPYFFYQGGTLSRVPLVHTDELGYEYRTHVYHPPGYHENSSADYPIVYLHDEHQTLFPEATFFKSQNPFGRQVEILDEIHPDGGVLVCCVWTQHKDELFSKAKFAQYGSFITGQLRQTVERSLRVKEGRENRAFIGNALGGVAALHIAWNWPDIFGKAASLSGDFGVQDNLFERLAEEDYRKIKLYLDSSKSDPHHSANRTLFEILAQRGYVGGRELMHMVHNAGKIQTDDWETRLQVPLQFLFPPQR